VFSKNAQPMTYRITLDIPVEAMSALRQNPEEFAREILEAALCQWYEQGRVSQSKAVEIANISRQEFIELLNKYDVSPFQYLNDNLRKEIGL
jgi:predicted HTH domain antitoxin